MSSGLNINTIKMKKFIQWEILDVNVKINKAEKELENLSNVIMVFIQNVKLLEKENDIKYKNLSDEITSKIIAYVS